MFRNQKYFNLKKNFLTSRKMRHSISIILECLDGQKYVTLEDISKYFINFGFLMAFANFNINEIFL